MRPRALSPLFLGRRALVITASGALALGCITTSGASKNAFPVVRVQASSDLDCPQSEIRLTQDLGGRVTAIGCGHKITYNTACEGLQCSVAPEGQTLPWRARPDPTPQPR